MVFDFDRTLTVADTMFPFVAHVARRRAPSALPKLRAARALRRLRLLTKTGFKSYATKLVLVGMREMEVVEAARDLPVEFRANVVARLNAHVDAGDEVVVVTASLELVVREMMTRAREVPVIGSTLEMRDDVVAGFGRANEGAAKLRGLEAHLGSAAIDVVYTDGRGDLPLMRAAREVNLVVAGAIVRLPSI